MWTYQVLSKEDERQEGHDDYILLDQEPTLCSAHGSIGSIVVWYVLGLALVLQSLVMRCY